MTILFEEINVASLVPGTEVEVTEPRIESIPAAQRNLYIVAPMLAGGTAVADQPNEVSAEAQAADLFVAGSIAHRLAVRALNRLPGRTIYVAGIDDPSGGIVKKIDIEFGGTVTGAGTVVLNCGGDLIQIAVASGAALTDIGDDAVAAFEAADDDFQFAGAVNVAGTVTISSRHKGTVVESLRIVVDPRFKLPAGLTVSITENQAPTGVPDLSAAIAAIPPQSFISICSAYNDDTSLDALEAEMARRFTAAVNLDGILYTAKSGTFGALSTYLESRNFQLEAILTVPVGDHADYEVAVDLAANAAAQTIFARPRVGDTMTVSARDFEFEDSERNSLLEKGGSTATNGADGLLHIERVRSTYTLLPDNSSAGPKWRDIPWVEALIEFRRRVKTAVADITRNKVLKPDNGKPVNKAAITPLVAKGQSWPLFNQAEEDLLIEDAKVAFDAAIFNIGADPTQLHIQIDPNIINPGYRALVQINPIN